MCASTTVPSSWRTRLANGVDSTALVHFSSILARHWQKAWIESLTGRLRDELLNLRRFGSLLEARVIIDD